MDHFSTILQPEQEPALERVVRPFQRFFKEEAAGGIVLIFCAVAALVWANVWEHNYESLWETQMRLGIGDYFIEESLHFWINDALMAIFFFVVGLEIKREMVGGGLSSPRRAALPVAAAIGGMAVPALIYTAFNATSDGSDGWGIPMATDIAFSLGVLALMGSRAPMGLKIFLAALAIVDDIGAVIVIAVFFTDQVSWINVAVGGGLLGVLAIANRVGVVHTMFYALVGAAVWLSFLQSGIHATVAGVLIAATIPMKIQINTAGFVEKGRLLLDQFETGGYSGPNVPPSNNQRAAVHDLELACQDVESPLQRIEHELHPWVALGIMPLFALANAGVVLGSDAADSIAKPVTLGVFFGLLVGKPLGIFGFAWLLAKSGFSTLPAGLSWRHIFGVAILGGIGFTMSLFITGLAFEDLELTAQSKLGILVASIAAGVAGWLVLRGCAPVKDWEESEPEDESSAVEIAPSEA